MSKTITIRVPDETYKHIAAVAKSEHRPISNFINHVLCNALSEMFTTDAAEMKEILSDKELMQSMKKGEQEIKEGKYKIVG